MELARSQELNEYYAMIDSLAADPRILQMYAYIQHGRVSTLDHVKSVARMTFRLNTMLHAHGDKETLLYGAMLHDYYLYDWHHYDGGHFHGFTHPAAAAENAVSDFEVSPEVEKVIRSHMWPLTILHVPSSREAWIVSMADKIVSLNETVRKR